jgi:hypothetical protein
MMFFTPELYARLNSPRSEEFDRASKEWDAALGHYREEIEFLSSRMPNRIRQLATKYRFHDSEVLSMAVETAETTSRSNGLSRSGKPGEASEYFTFTLMSELWAHFVFYVLSRPIVRKQHVDVDVFCGEKVFWLYDEVRPDPQMPSSEITPDAHGAIVSGRSNFVHGVLLSNGLELEIPFSDVFIQAIPLPFVFPGSAPPETAAVNYC